MAEHPSPTGATRLAAVIGSPVRHSRSPQLIDAAFRSRSLDWTFVALEVAEGRAADAVDAMRVLGLGGLSVTMPHKAGVIAALDRLTDDARELNAVNCIAWEGDELVGHNTDGPGLLASLALDHQLDVRDLRCAVVGAGGAARSVIRALAGAGAAEVAVINRTAERAEVAAELAGRVGTVAGPEAIAEADLVINATSVGMGAAPGADGPSPIDAGRFRPGQTVVDLVYLPLVTPMLAAAADRGARTVGGLGMLVHQAALAVRLWTGVEPDVAVMEDAARA